MKVRQLVPRAEDVELEDVLHWATSGSAGLFQPFAPEVMGFCADLSQALFADAPAKAFPELQALAFWLRKAALTRMKESFDALKTDHAWPVPRGLVFHVPPANVDTIFMYSWLMSVLAGNRNLLRISQRASEQIQIVCRVFNDRLQAAPALQGNTVMIQYGHEAEITAAVSAVADVRVVWGGDETVNTLRAVPVPPHCKELTFPDRYSLAAIRAARYLGLDGPGRRDLAAKFFNDTYWFEQMACSSPRLLVWCGDPEECARAAGLFWDELAAEIARRGYSADLPASMEKFAFLCRAILDRPVTSARRFDNALTVAQLGTLERLDRDDCGGGFVFQYHTARLQDIAPHVGRKDQTLTCFGFEAGEKADLVRQLNGRGVDRIVPIGQALTFQRYWDGYDLLHEMIRYVYVE